MQTIQWEGGNRAKKHQSNTKACMPQDGDRRTKIAQENWQRTSTASFWPVCFKTPQLRNATVWRMLVGAGLHCHPASISVCKTFDIFDWKSWYLHFDSVYCRWKEICTAQKLMRCLRKQCTVKSCIFSTFDKEPRRKPQVFSMHTNRFTDA